MRITMHPSKPLSWWYSRKNAIDVSPTYQRRGRLWSQSDKAYLIDSIINGFDIPKLYFADFQFGENPLNAKKLPYAVIDGKQRLEAIFDFFDGTLTLNEDFVWRADRSVNLGGLSLKDLRNNHRHIAELFETESIDVMSVVTNDLDDISELFIRLNRSKPLTGAEIRNAMKGPVPDVIRSIASHTFFSETVKFSTLRGGDYNAAAKLLAFEFYGKPVATKKKDLDLFSQENTLSNHDKIALAGRKCIDILEVMQTIFLPKDKLLSSAGPLPVYYWLSREADEESAANLREFLVFFENQRVIARNPAGSNAAEVSAETIIKYENFNRSVNDLGSQVGRFNILNEEFKAWIKR